MADVGGVSEILCCCYYCPGSPSQFYSVVVGRVGFFWTAFHGCEIVPIGEVPPWWAFHHGFRQGLQVIHITRTGEPLEHYTSVMGKLAHRVRIPHEDGWVPHGADMRQPGEDRVSSILLSTVQYRTRTNRADQNEVPSNETDCGLPPKGVKPSKIKCWDPQSSQPCHELFLANR